MGLLKNIAGYIVDKALDLQSDSSYIPSSKKEDNTPRLKYVDSDIADITIDIIKDRTEKCVLCAPLGNDDYLKYEELEKLCNVLPEIDYFVTKDLWLVILEDYNSLIEKIRIVIPYIKDEYIIRTKQLVRLFIPNDIFMSLNYKDIDVKTSIDGLLELSKRNNVNLFSIRRYVNTFENVTDISVEIPKLTFRQDIMDPYCKFSVQDIANIEKTKITFSRRNCELLGEGSLEGRYLNYEKTLHYSDHNIIGYEDVNLELTISFIYKSWLEKEVEPVMYICAKRKAYRVNENGLKYTIDSVFEICRLDKVTPDITLSNCLVVASKEDLDNSRYSEDYLTKKIMEDIGVYIRCGESLVMRDLSSAYLGEKELKDKYVEWKTEHNLQ